MIMSIKIRLLPTENQEILMRKSIGVARFTYNWGMAKWEELYRQGYKPSKGLIRKEFNNTLKKDENYQWLNEVSGQITGKAFDDLNNAYTNFFKGKAKHPNFKSKKKCKQSFYARYDAIKFNNSKVNIEKIGKIEYSTNYDIPIFDKYINPRVSFDGEYWYLSLGFEQSENQAQLNQELSVGIDLGIKDLAVVNCLEKPIKNINKTKKLKKLKKKLRRLQKQVSRKYGVNKEGVKFVKTKNIIKLEKQIKLLHRKLFNIRNNHIHQATNKIIKLKPYRVVMENLNISGMMKNKHLSKAIQEQCFYEFKRQMEYKCKFNGIKFIQVDRFYPSSKTCSKCGHIKKDLKLKNREFICLQCGCVIDRDKNASINLGRYGLV